MLSADVLVRAEAQRVAACIGEIVDVKSVAISDMTDMVIAMRYWRPVVTTLIDAYRQTDHGAQTYVPYCTDRQAIASVLKDVVIMLSELDIKAVVLRAVLNRLYLEEGGDAVYRKAITGVVQPGLSADRYVMAPMEWEKFVAEATGDVAVLWGLSSKRIPYRVFKFCYEHNIRSTPAVVAVCDKFRADIDNQRQRMAAARQHGEDDGTWNQLYRFWDEAMRNWESVLAILGGRRDKFVVTLHKNIEMEKELVKAGYRKDRKTSIWRKDGFENGVVVTDGRMYEVREDGKLGKELEAVPGIKKAGRPKKTENGPGPDAVLGAGEE